MSLEETFSPKASDGFIELLGNRVFVSVNYDKRFSSGEKGHGGRTRVGFVPTIGFVEHGLTSIFLQSF